MTVWNIVLEGNQTKKNATRIQNILTNINPSVWKYLKLKILISSFKYFRTVKQKIKFVCLVFGRIHGTLNCLQSYLTFKLQILSNGFHETLCLSLSRRKNILTYLLLFCHNAQALISQNVLCCLIIHDLFTTSFHSVPPFS